MTAFNLYPMLLLLSFVLFFPTTNVCENYSNSILIQKLTYKVNQVSDTSIEDSITLSAISISPLSKKNVTINKFKKNVSTYHYPVLKNYFYLNNAIENDSSLSFLTQGYKPKDFIEEATHIPNKLKKIGSVLHIRYSIFISRIFFKNKKEPYSKVWERKKKFTFIYKINLYEVDQYQSKFLESHKPGKKLFSFIDTIIISNNQLEYSSLSQIEKFKPLSEISYILQLKLLTEKLGLAIGEKGMFISFVPITLPKHYFDIMVIEQSEKKNAYYSYLAMGGAMTRNKEKLPYICQRNQQNNKWHDIAFLSVYKNSDYWRNDPNEKKKYSYPLFELKVAYLKK